MKPINFKTPTISKARKTLASVPFFIIASITTGTWYKFYTQVYVPSVIHYLTLIFVVINGIMLFLRFKPALLMTGCILLLSGFGLLFFFTCTSSFLGIFGITIPFEGWSFLLFIFYFAINCDILINWRLDAKRNKPVEKSNSRHK